MSDKLPTPVDDKAVGAEAKLTSRQEHDGRAIKLIVVLSFVLTMLVIVGVGALVLGIMFFGYRSSRGIERETELAATELGSGIARCAAKTGSLPETSNPVPARFEQVADKRYDALPVDWSSPTWRCAEFTRTSLSYQIRWVRKDEHGGTAIAIAKHRDAMRVYPVDFEVEVSVDCETAARCTARKPPTLSSARRGLEDSAVSE